MSASSASVTCSMYPEVAERFCINAARPLLTKAANLSPPWHHLQQDAIIAQAIARVSQQNASQCYVLLIYPSFLASVLRSTCFGCRVCAAVCQRFARGDISKERDAGQRKYQVTTSMQECCILNTSLHLFGSLLRCHPDSESFRVLHWQAAAGD